jgi:hypothetical protein
MYIPWFDSMPLRAVALDGEAVPARVAVVGCGKWKTGRVTPADHLPLAKRGKVVANQFDGSTTDHAMESDIRVRERLDADWLQGQSS